jgi:hypothetical protein
MLLFVFLANRFGVLHASKYSLGVRFVALAVYAISAPIRVPDYVNRLGNISQSDVSAVHLGPYRLTRICGVLHAFKLPLGVRFVALGVDAISASSHVPESVHRLGNCIQSDVSAVLLVPCPMTRIRIQGNEGGWIARKSPLGLNP